MAGDPHDYRGLEVLVAQEITLVRSHLPPDVGATLFLWHVGADGGLAYGSTGDRASMISAVIEWLGHQDPEAVNKALRAWVDG